MKIPHQTIYLPEQSRKYRFNEVKNASILMQEFRAYK